MIDIEDLRKNPEKYKKGTKDKQYDPKVVDVALELDKEWREALQSVEKLRQERNAISRERSSEAISKGQKIKLELKKLDEDLTLITEKYNQALREIPNPPAPDVKVGKNDTENDVIKTWEKPRKFDFDPKSHYELGNMLGIIDTDRAGKVSGARFGYLKGDGVRLEFALIQYALETLTKEGFTPVLPPVLIKREMMEEMGYLEHGGEEDMYVLDKDNLILVGTSEQSIGPMHAGETLNGKDLPLRYMGFSTCFRREAGSYGKDTKGILRVHQFDKVEMFSFVKPEEGDKEHEYFLSLEEKFLQGLKIPYQISKMCTGDLGVPVARKFDIEGWFPSEGKYRELTSTSTTTDFQSRGLDIKYKEGNESMFLHMINGTAFSGRPILAILENYQEKDGSVTVPEVLRKWVGKEKITPR